MQFPPRPRPTPTRRRSGSSSTLARALRVGLTLAALAPRALAAMPQEPVASPQPPEVGAGAAGSAGSGATPPAAPPLVRGQLRSRYLSRWTDDHADNDLFTTLSVDVGDSERHDVTAHLMGRVTWDMDGRDRTFASINDSYGGPFDTLLYDAWVDLHRLRGLSRLRIGRQSTSDTPVFTWFDGVHATSEEFGAIALQVGAYFGSSTHLYEASKSGDLTAGAYAQLRPWATGRLRVDYQYFEDDARFRGHKDGLLGVGFWQNFGKALQVDAQYSRIEDRDRDARARFSYRLPEHGLFVQASYYRLLQSQGDLVLELDPYFNALNELQPYNKWSLLISKTLVEKLTVSAAADLRRVASAADVGVYNRDYDHYYANAVLADLWVSGLSVTGTLDLWDSNGQLLKSGGCDASYAFGQETVSLGTYYSLYKFDLFTNTERDHVRTYFLRLRHAATDALTFEGNYEFEDTDLAGFHRLRLGVTWRF